METQEPLVYSIRQACKVLDMGKTKLFEELKSGRLKAKKNGHRTLIPRESAIEWLNNLPVR